MHHRGSQQDCFPWSLILWISLKIWSNSDKNLLYSLQEDPSTFGWSRRQIRYRCILVHHYYNVDSDTCLNNVHRTHCWVSTAKKVTRIRHNIKLYVHCITFFLTPLYLFCIIIIGLYEVKRHKICRYEIGQRCSITRHISKHFWRSRRKSELITCLFY